MSSPPVTIGLPVYNGENYLLEAIESLVQQTFDDFLLIISDNASTDSTEELGRQAAAQDHRITYHRHGHNLGAAANYNYSADQAESEFFLWHAHDDLRAPEYLERTVSLLRQTPDASIAFSKATRIGPDGQEGGAIPRPEALLSERLADRIRAVITCPFPDLMLFGLSRRELLAKTGRHGSFKGGDRLYVAEMSMLGRLVEVDEPLFYNRDHPDRYVRMKGSGADATEKRSWWDTSAQRGLDLPRWKGLRGYLAAARRLGDHDPRTRAAAHAAILKSLGDNRFYVTKLLVRDVLSSAIEIGQRPFRSRD